LAFGGRIMANQGIHLAPIYDGYVRPLTLCDDYGEVDIYLLPFLKPAHVRRFFPDAAIDTYTDALRTALCDTDTTPPRRRVLVAHQFVTGAVGCDSESISVGGTDNVDAAVFDAFDYVALGHLHRPQQVTRPTVRYCGTPLPYSFSECSDEKSVTVVELHQKGDVQVRTVPLTPLRKWIQLRGTYMELTDRSFYSAFDTQSYVHITLTDEQDIPEVLGRLRAIYPNLMRLDYDNHRTRASRTDALCADTTAQENPLQLLDDFYQLQNGQALDEPQKACALQHMQRIWEELL
jgi:exonuclease SbcD